MKFNSKWIYRSKKFKDEIILTSFSKCLKIDSKRSKKFLV